MAKSKLSNLIELRDFSKGRYTPTRVNSWLTPLNSVRDCLNVDFDVTAGSAVVRAGSQAYYAVARPSAALVSQAAQGGTSFSLYGANWLGQTLSTVSTGISLYSAQFLVHNSTATPLVGNITVGIYATSGGLPTGSALVVTQLDASSLGTTFSYANFYFGYGGFAMTAGVTYALVLSYATGTSTNYVVVSSSASAAPVGQEVQSSNSGSSWATGPSPSVTFASYKTSNTAYSQKPLGILNAATQNQTGIFSAFPDPSMSADVVYFNLVPTNITYWSPTAKVRFATMNGSVFIVNGVNPMRDCPSTWTNFQFFGTTNSITTDSVVPSLLCVSSGYMLASGYVGYSSRIYVSSQVSAASSPFITWNTNPTTGTWIDVNPDDGYRITALQVVGASVIVWKNGAMYRMDAATQTVDPEPVANIGCASQEACVVCQGISYVYTGKEIRKTDGSIPVQISRFGVQDLLDGIQDTSVVSLGTDGLNVFVYCGTVVYTNRESQQVTIQNCVLKFSTLDESWTVRSYAKPMNLFSFYNYGQSTLIQSADGTIKFLDNGLGDDGAPVNYFLETQTQECGDLSHTDSIPNQVVAFSGVVPSGTLQVKNEEPQSKWKLVSPKLQQQVTVSDSVNIRGKSFVFRWSGTTKAEQPVFEGVSVPEVDDEGVVK